jgi:hypothetical protein
MKWLLTLILFISAAGSCDSVEAETLDDWHPANKRLFYSYAALNTMDVLQTFDLIDCQKHIDCTYWETNSLVGTHPSKGEILLIKSLSMAGTYYLLRSANERERFVALSVINIMMFKTVSSNHSIGLRFHFSF